MAFNDQKKQQQEGDLQEKLVQGNRATKLFIPPIINICHATMTEQAFDLIVAELAPDQGMIFHVVQLSCMSVAARMSDGDSCQRIHQQHDVFPLVSKEFGYRGRHHGALYSNQSRLIGCHDDDN